MASSESRKRKLEEYEMQLFGFHSRAVYATMRNIISDRICGTIENLCETIEKTCKLKSENVEILKANQKGLEKAYCKGALPHLNTIETIVNKFIAVPSNVLLEEDKYQRTQYTEEEYENMKQSLEELQQRTSRATMLNEALKKELQILEQLPISEDSINGMRNVIEKGLQCPNVNDKMVQLAEDYKQFSSSLYGAISTTEKSKYASIENLKCKDFDLNSL